MQVWISPYITKQTYAYRPTSAISFGHVSNQKCKLLFDIHGADHAARRATTPAQAVGFGSSGGPEDATGCLLVFRARGYAVAYY